jgi:aminoglycoside 6-adenylyltransferase
MRSLSDHSRPFPNVLGKLIGWADTRDSVRAVLLTSTRAIPSAIVDILSDYDVILVVRDIQPWVDNHTWLEDFGEVLVAYWDPIHPDPFSGFDICGNVIQYTGGLKIDFTLWPVSLLQQIASVAELPAELDAGYRILLDKDHLTGGMQAPSGKAYIPRRPTLAEYQAIINDFLNDAPYVAKCLWRDELLPAKWCLDYDMKHVYLRQVLEWRVEIDQGWSVPVGALGKGLKKSLPAEIWNSLDQCYADAQIGNNWVALVHTLELFRKVAQEVGQSLGFPYPDQLHDRVVAYVEHIRSL